MSSLATSNGVSEQEKLNQLEADLGEWRNQMALGYLNSKTGKFEKGSSVQLRNSMRTDASEDVRKACWEVRPFPLAITNLLKAFTHPCWHIIKPPIP